MTKWEEKVKKDCDEITKKNNLSKLSKLKFYPRMTIFILFITLTIITSLIIMVLSYFYSAFVIGWVAISLWLVNIIILAIALFLIFKARSKDLKIKNEIINSLDFFNYYSLAFKEIWNDKYQLTTLSNFFDVEPINFLPEKGANATDEVLKFFGNDINYSYGTIINEKINLVTAAKGGQLVQPVYTRYCFLNLSLQETTNLNAIIQPSKSFLKLFKKQNNIDLKSIQFEQVYSLETDDQINVTKYLNSKVIKNLISLAYVHREHIPKIAILNQQVSFLFDSFEVLGWNDPEKRIDFLRYQVLNKY